jgi:hypothetical protein
MVALVVVGDIRIQQVDNRHQEVVVDSSLQRSGTEPAWVVQAGSTTRLQ